MSKNEDTNRQAFDIQQGQKQDDENFITVDKPHVALTVWNLLITGTCIGLFSYVNTYFSLNLQKLENGSIITFPTPTFSCDYYYCDQTLYNYLNYYTFFKNCNAMICTTQICSSYTPQCGNGQYYPDLNRFFACEPGCANYQPSNIPPVLTVAYGLTIAAAISFGLFLLVQILGGIVFNIKAREISAFQRIGLLLSFTWPSLKYYFLRKRNDWQDFDLNLRAVVIVDYICAGLLTVTMAIYIWFYAIGTWFDNKEIALFFILLGAYISYWLMCWSNGRTFWKAKERFA